EKPVLCPLMVKRPARNTTPVTLISAAQNSISPNNFTDTMLMVNTTSRAINAIVHCAHGADDEHGLRYCNALVMRDTNSVHDSYLLSGLFARALLIIESNARGSQSILWESFGGRECSCSSTRPIGVLAVNGVEPVINSKAVHANAYSSVAAE